MSRALSDLTRLIKKIGHLFYSITATSVTTCKSWVCLGSMSAYSMKPFNIHNIESVHTCKLNVVSIIFVCINFCRFLWRFTVSRIRKYNGYTNTTMCSKYYYNQTIYIYIYAIVWIIYFRRKKLPLFLMLQSM